MECLHKQFFFNAYQRYYICVDCEFKLSDQEFLLSPYNRLRRNYVPAADPVEEEIQQFEKKHGLNNELS